MMSSSKAVNARGESGFTLIDMLFVIALIGLLSTLAIPGLMRAKGAAQSASALGSLKVVNSAQLSFAITCGLGLLRAGPQTLGEKPPAALDAFLPPEMSSGLDIHQERLRTSAWRASAFPARRRSCNGLAVGRSVVRLRRRCGLARHDAAGLVISGRTPMGRSTRTRPASLATMPETGAPPGGTPIK